MKVLLLIASAILATPTLARDGPTYFFTFGDSYTQTGFSPSSSQPSASNPMGNPTLGIGTTTGGPNWVGYATTTYNTSLVLSYNLAVGGATIDNWIVPSYAGDFVAQVNLFQATYNKRLESAPWTGENAVFGVWVGINDIGNAYSNTDADEFTPRLVNRYLSLVEKIYADGGRKFLFLNVPPTSRSPNFLAQGEEVVEKHTAYLATFNKNLEAGLKAFQANHTDVTTVFYDSFSFMSKVLDEPRKYGFPNATCINDDGSSCIWWNDYHPTAKYHKLQTEDMNTVMKALGAW